MRELAMFPLGTVVFPYASLALHVFEPRYRALVRDLLAADGEFGTVLIERGSEVGGGDARFDIGTLVRMVRCEQFPDGRYGLVVVGVGRLRVVEWLVDDPYPRALVESQPECAGPARSGWDAQGARERVEGQLRELDELARRLDPGFAPVPPEPLESDAVVSSYHLCARAPLGALDALRVLAADDPATRLDLLSGALAEQVLLMRARLGD